ncbi:putative serine protease K12H4.7 [Bacillus rossius redtenbacheri]|uniref:putative serine protease K12H4.7 n=1 Tax=Bacillus rossius redtenbacheri TaxID=93214 RepID=UPI002FDEC7BE
MHLFGMVCVLLTSALCSEAARWRSTRGRHFVHRGHRTPAWSRETSPTAQWFRQELDHFNATNTATWNQKYYVSKRHHRSGGPVFLYINGEDAADPGWFENAAWMEYAEEFHALCFIVEHRFYGDSRPTRDLSVEHLRYLSSEQALADFAAFVRGMQTKYSLPASTKWVAFGGSYAGALAAWLRLKYPDRVHAAVSSSGTLLAVADFQDFYGTVVSSLSTSGEGCVEAIQSATTEMSSLLGSSGGQESVKKLFGMCSGFDAGSLLDAGSLYCVLADGVADVVQDNNNDKPSWDSSSTDVDAMCRVMTNASVGSPAQRYSALTALTTGSGEDDCADYSYRSTVDYVLDTAWGGAGDGDRQWMYQTCTEFGFFGTSSLAPHVFGDKFPLEYFVQQCSDVFGSRFNATSLNAGVKRTNKIYGGRSIQVSNVVFVQGSIDPWHTLGITHSNSNSSPAIFIKDTSHCADMLGTSSTDLPQLTAARAQIRGYLRQWLSA